MDAEHAHATPRPVPLSLGATVTARGPAAQLGAIRTTGGPRPTAPPQEQGLAHDADPNREPGGALGTDAARDPRATQRDPLADRVPGAPQAGGLRERFGSPRST